MTSAVALDVIPREEFVQRRFAYKPGEHVTIMGATQNGKTYLAYQLLSQVSNSKLPAVTLVMKPKDPTTAKFAKEQKHKIVRHWPPPVYSTLQTKPPGWILWPKHTYDPDKDDARLYREFRRAILDSYKRGHRIVFADEVAGLVTDLSLGRELVTVWTRAASNKTGIWAATQRPAYVPLAAYTNAEHVFLSYEPDKRGRDRFNEIGGVDGKLVSDTVLQLKKYQWLYIRRTDRAMCIVDK